MKALQMRGIRRSRAIRIEAERIEIGRRLETEEQLLGGQLFKYYKKHMMLNARGYQVPGCLEGNVHLVFGEQWAEWRLPILSKEYLECSPVLLNLGEVTHLELVNDESTAMRWVELIRALVSPSDAAENEGST